MAFVFRSKANTLNNTLTPGPGQYQKPPPKESALSTAPFNQTSARKIWQENSLPGPGAYQLEDHKSKEKTVIKNCGNAFAIIETPAESSIFKSHSKRFQSTEESLPGPGQYSLEAEKVVKQRIPSQSNSLQKYLQKTKIHNGTQQVGLLAIGEEENNRETSTHSFQAKKEKKSVPFQTKEERCKPIRPQTSLGPGSYEISQAKLQKECFNRKKVTQSITKFKKELPQDNIHLQIGKYSSEEPSNKFTKASFNSKKDDFFGSSVSRFSNGIFKNNTPGPGEYEIDSVKTSTAMHVPIKKPAFGRSAQENKMRQVFVSPFQVKVNQRPHKQYKKKTTPEGCFVFKEARFKETKNINMASSYSSADLFLGREDHVKSHEAKKLQRKHSSKLLIRRQIPKQSNNDERPLSYATEAFTISAKNKQKCQIKAPFLSYVNRFEQTSPNTVAEFQNLYCQNAAATEYKQNQCGGSQVSRRGKTAKGKGVMDSKNPRFNYRSVENEPSPFSYDPVKPKSKEFNKLFL